MPIDKDELVPIKVKEQLTALLSEDQDIKRLLTMSFNETVISTYNSHFPESQELQKLEEIVPGITERMLTMMEKHQDREIEFDQNMIKTENRRIDTISKDIDKIHNTNRLGQVLGFIIALCVLGIAAWLISNKEYKTALGLVLGAGALGVIVSSFTGYFSKNTSKEDNKSEDASN